MKQAIWTKSRKNIILADCTFKSDDEFKSGLESSLGLKFECYSCVCNKHGGLNDVKRLLTYIFYPLKFVFRRNSYEYVIGWQQFFALFYCFWSRVFHLKKCNIVVAANFTYKKKKGIIGLIYKKVMEFVICSKYLDYLHVPSQNYADLCSKEFSLNRNKFIVAHFGIDDINSSLYDLPVEYNNYSFSIGRSNRDYDWLANLWGGAKSKSLLVIASDTWEPKKKLPTNVVHRRDIKGLDQYMYIVNAEQIIIPIDNGNICSGDTVLLTSMALSKLVFVSAPSTLSEMYINDGVDGVYFQKNSDELLAKIEYYRSHPDQANKIKKKAREKFLEKYTRYNLGLKMGDSIKTR